MNEHRTPEDGGAFVSDLVPVGGHAKRSRDDGSVGERLVVPATHQTGLRRLSVFLADLSGGGAERVMVQLASGIAARGVAVDLVLASSVGPYLDEVASGVRVVDLGGVRVARAIGPLRDYLRLERPDMIFTTLQHASVAAAVARAWAAVPALLVVREATTPSRRRFGLLDFRSRLLRSSMRAVYRSADGVVAVSEGVADDLHRSGVPRSKLWTLYSPLVPSDVRQRAAVEPDHPWLLDPSVPVVLGVGSLVPNKGFRILLEAVKRVRQRREVRLVVLGEGAQRAALEAYAVGLGIAEHVAFVGFRPNPYSYMARAAVYVLASEREGLPGALVQAMACGCPVVATDCPSGPAEVLANGAFGRLVTVGDADAMAQAVIRTLDEPRDAERLRVRADRFADNRVIDDHLTIFERAVRDRKAGTHRASMVEDERRSAT